MADDNIESTIKVLISHPERVVLFRGEKAGNHGGLHFTPNKEWAMRFSDEGGVLLKGTLPANSKIRILDDSDIEYGLSRGFSSEDLLWDHIFADGYDAIIGHDAMSTKIIDVIVNRKHLHYFTAI